jgi:hypothetical protein
MILLFLVILLWAAFRPVFRLLGDLMVFFIRAIVILAIIAWITG